MPKNIIIIYRLRRSSLHKKHDKSNEHKNDNTKKTLKNAVQQMQTYEKLAKCPNLHDICPKNISPILFFSWGGIPHTLPPCVTDSVVYPPTGSKANVREMITLPTPQGMVPFTSRLLRNF